MQTNYFPLLFSGIYNKLISIGFKYAVIFASFVTYIIICSVQVLLAENNVEADSLILKSCCGRDLF